MHKGSRCSRYRKLALNLAATAAICLLSRCAGGRALQPRTPAAPEILSAKNSPAIGESPSGAEACSSGRSRRRHGNIAPPRVSSQFPTSGRVPDPAFPNLFTHDEDLFLTPPAHCPLGTTLPLQSEVFPPPGEEALDVAGENCLSLGDRLPDGRESLLLRVGHDHLNYYSAHSVLLLGAGFGAAALIAHTSLDEDVYGKVHWNVWHGGNRDWAKRLHAMKGLGDGTYTLPVFAGAWLAGEMLGEAPFAGFLGLDDGVCSCCGR